MFNIDLYSDIPIYQQIVDGYKVLVINNFLNDGDKIPAIRELAAQLEVNPSTVAKAYAQLEREGLIKTSRGRGTYISTDNFDKNNVLKDIKEQLSLPIKNAKDLRVSVNELIEIIKTIYKELDNEV